jgi:hypothetical protein
LEPEFKVELEKIFTESPSDDLNYFWAECVLEPYSKLIKGFLIFISYRYYTLFAYSLELESICYQLPNFRPKNKGKEKSQASFNEVLVHLRKKRDILTQHTLTPSVAKSLLSVIQEIKSLEIRGQLKSYLFNSAKIVFSTVAVAGIWYLNLI